MKNPHDGWPDFGTPGASGTEKMSNDGLSYANYHRHFEQPSNSPPQLSMDQLSQKADTLYVTLPSATVSAIPEMPTELAAAITSGDLPAVNALFKRRDGHGGNGDKKKKQQQCWYHIKFGDECRCCSGLPCPRYRADLPKGRTTESGNAKGSR